MKKIIQNIRQNIKLIAAVLLVGIFLGWLFFHNGGTRTTELNGQELAGHEGHDHESANQIWTCSMHPQIKMDKPGKCPICAMELIPLVQEDGGQEDAQPNEVVMSESAIKLADVETLVVTKGTPQKNVFLQGKLQADERNIAELTARFGGRIEKLLVNYTGQEVKKGEKLAILYSPDLVTAQRELLEAIGFKETRPAIYLASKAKLKLWDLTDEQISAIEEKGEPQVYFDILSPISGTVTMRHVSLGDYIKEGMPLFQVIDLTKVWGMFDAYESDLPWVKLGDQVDFTVQAIPGKNFSARVTYIDPFINGQTRIAKVRVEVSNKSGELKPEMFLNGFVSSKMAEKSSEILIPKSSILWTGKRAVVYVKVPNRKMPSFLYREIVLGPEAGAFYVVADGLMEGEEIATNGVFKIDAAAQLLGLPSMMNPEGGAGSTPHDMSKMNMGGSKKKPAKSGLDSKSNPDSKAKSDPEFNKQLLIVIENYMQLKDAFVNSDEKDAEARAKTTLDALDKVDMGLLTGDAHNTWMGLVMPLKNNLSGIVQMQGIEMKRGHFSVVSDKLAMAVKMFGVKAAKDIYKDFCPMANNNEGAYWLSYDKEIKNPYLGDKMPKCGEIKETFTK